MKKAKKSNDSTRLQVSAFSSSWGVLFLLSAVENRLMQSSTLANERVSDVQTRARLVSVVAQLEQLALDANEFNHLRLLSLMKGNLVLL